MTEEQDEGLKELGLVISANKNEEVWHTVAENLKNVVSNLEKELEMIPEQIKVNRELLEFAKSKAPKNATG